MTQGTFSIGKAAKILSHTKLLGTFITMNRLFTFSLITALILVVSGIYILTNSQNWAWPSSYSYSGNRFETSYAILEETYLFIGKSFLTSGLILKILTLIISLFKSIESNTPNKAVKPNASRSGIHPAEQDS